MLVEKHVPHSVLNANNAYWEAEIIAAAGQKNAVTVSTGMAGRGTDIKLGEGVRKLGGLAVIGLGRMQNTRLERQARGRAGRQGDPGSSQFFVSLEDEIVTQMYPEKDSTDPGRRPHASRAGGSGGVIDRAQRTIEEQSVSSREQAVRYDQILRRQREILYGARNRLLDGEAVPKRTRCVRNRAPEPQPLRGRASPAYPGRAQPLRAGQPVLRAGPRRGSPCSGTPRTPARCSRRMDAYAERLYWPPRRSPRSPRTEDLQDYTRACMLKALDEGWVEEVDYLQQLQYAIVSRGTAQRNPIFEYSREAYRSFQDMQRT
jgi:preprotein translocase subunit SecA